MVLVGLRGPIRGQESRAVCVRHVHIHMVYIQHSINAVMIIQQTCCSDRGTQPVGRLRICSRARPAINRHFRYKFNHQSRRRMCISNIQRPLASERPMCPILLIRPFDKQFRLRTQIAHQALLSANFKAPKGAVGRALHHGLQYKTLSNEATCVLRAGQCCLYLACKLFRSKLIKG